jgi:erythromycin esterase
MKYAKNFTNIFITLIFTFSWLFSCTGHAQGLVKVALNDSEDFSDLKQFGEAIAGKRIIYLDELTHGEHEVFALKSRLVKYLHQQHGFGALIIESGLFDVNEVVKKSTQDENQSIASQALGNIFFGYAKDPEFLQLMNYIDSKKQSDTPIALSGFDGRLSGEYSLNCFVKQLKGSIETLPKSKELLVGWPSYSQQLIDTLRRNFSPLDKRQIEQHILKSHQLMDALIDGDSSPALESPSYYARLLAGVIRLFEVHYQVRRFDEHDLVMADNLHWLLEHIYTDKKVIVWGHYVHLNRQGYLKMRQNNVTTALSKAYGEQSYIVNFSGLSGQYREFRDGTVINLPALGKQHLAFHLQNSFESKPHAIFVEPEQFEQEKFQNLVLYGHEYLTDFQVPVHLWRNHYDSVFFINKVSASN